ncbi:MAG TPA: hypothetical protein DDX54_04240 [Rhodospirillaceae bacterium]|jgi:hypothetical protein|nr:hypothetical protein [Alphaproteobacteria bacterium]HBH26593.1 hypothetical protein [Rhodospirillaceae bacterium]
MTDTETGERLTAAGATCVKAWKAWTADPRDEGKRGALAEAAHELRRALARLEIDMAKSERAGATQKPLPIPEHKAGRRDGSAPRHAAPEGNAGEDVPQPPPRRGMRRRLTPQE